MSDGGDMDRRSLITLSHGRREISQSVHDGSYFLFRCAIEWSIFVTCWSKQGHRRTCAEKETKEKNNKEEEKKFERDSRWSRIDNKNMTMGSTC